ncbi:hypothetical protein PHYBLDRAFT_22752 [Phycomyces blakesleeanus NRRL 1555(-)]|nr:hypothetical protein PHYBLDRAFT_22752 [Phycomyces blakesleeanus NRRL 1555(-)]OAD74424.1 hypothetical protein PHYBLDRAFT_22752 [Phycomyces blakesleeanus NRRL 1555(-)]|eukprot:XP_018292464.1 hypothetical protein PHYBLDRAFT_22752 [Phycomyces blakesleeanus NRRL 1555(-)]
MPLTKDTIATTSSDAAASHALLVKAGFVRQSSSGIFGILPMGLRTIEKIEHIIDEEMQAIGSQKLSLPLLLSSESWKKTGRWSGAQGEFFHLKDRKDTDLLLAPTHEEEITQLVGSELRSAKQLPIRLYQIGRKYRDELRPRAGLLRGREFIMKDMYSFDATVEEAYSAYDAVTAAYYAIFRRIGIPFVVAEADSGNMGGSKSHEYHLVSSVGEDTLLTCTCCGYTANEELATGHLKTSPSLLENTPVEHTHEPLGTYEATHAMEFSYAKYTGQNQNNEAVTGYTVIVTPKGRTVNLLKVQTSLGRHLQSKEKIQDGSSIELNGVHHKTILSIPEEIKKSDLHVFLDNGVMPLKYTLAQSGFENATVHAADHYRIAEAGDFCNSCHEDGKSTPLSSVKAIEVGHTFYLGTKYSAALDCGFKVPSQPEKVPAQMGCYGIGVTRLLASVAEATHDDRGIVWPTSIAPYSVCIVPTHDKNVELHKVADKIYDQLEATRFLEKDIIMDDRKAGFGSKMKDAELIGYPFIAVVGQKAISNQIVELHERVKGEKNIVTEVPLGELEKWIQQRLSV